MDSLITAPGRVVAVCGPLSPLNWVALREHRQVVAQGQNK